MFARRSVLLMDCLLQPRLLSAPLHPMTRSTQYHNLTGVATSHLGDSHFTRTVTLGGFLYALMRDVATSSLQLSGDRLRDA